MTVGKGKKGKNIAVKPEHRLNERENMFPLRSFPTEREKGS